MIANDHGQTYRIQKSYLPLGTVNKMANSSDIMPALNGPQPSRSAPIVQSYNSLEAGGAVVQPMPVVVQQKVFCAFGGGNLVTTRMICLRQK